MDLFSRFQCTYCQRTYDSEAWFMSHKCEQMIRNEEIGTPLGQAAWIIYQKWMKASKKSVNNVNQFIKSKRYYRTFMKFAEFTKKVKLTDIDIFIRMAVMRNIQPQLWTHELIYKAYLEFLDNSVTPQELAEITVDLVKKMADAADCPVDEIFSYLTPGEIAQLIRDRKLYPWILLRSQRFGDYFQTLDQDDKNHLISAIKPKFWKYKFEAQPDTDKWMKTKVRELGI